MNKLQKLSLGHPEKWPFFYGYVIVIVGTLGMLASLPGQTIGVSTFTDPVKDALGLNRDQFSNAYMLGTILSSFLLARAGVWYDKFGAKRVAFFATLGLGVTLVLCSKSDVLSQAIKNLTGVSSWIVPFVLMIGLFFLLRFSGQGVLTMVSRNMIMKWFDTKRGRVNAVSAIAVSMGFSASPIIIDAFIEQSGWQMAWQHLAIIVLAFIGIVLIFFSDNPEAHGLMPDGLASRKKKSGDAEVGETVQFTAKQALKTRAFWMYSLALAFYSFFVTGLTFHVVSVFEIAGYTKAQAIAIFIPATVVSVITSALFSFFSDFVKLKIYLYIMIFGAYLCVLGLLLIKIKMGVWLIIAGTGITGGMFTVLNAISFPRFFGRKHLGAITGKTMSMLVLGSALSPSIFSFSLTYFGTYNVVAYVVTGFLFFITIASYKANDPQEALKQA